MNFYIKMNWAQITEMTASLQVSEEANTRISGALTMEELCKALQGMELGKAPGIDGLPVDFYKSFWSEIGEDLLGSGQLSLSEHEQN